MHRYGGLPAWMAALAVLALCAALSLYLAAALAAYARWRSGRPLADALLFAAVWLLAELARGVIFTGFPWVASGYAQVDAPLGALAPWLGVYGIGAVAAALSAGAGAGLDGRPPALAPGWPPRRRCRRRSPWPGAGALPDFTRPTGALAVSLLQSNVPQDQKFERAHRGAAIRWHLDALAAARGDLVVAPETAIPLLPAQLPPGFWRRAARLVRAPAARRCWSARRSAARARATPTRWSAIGGDGAAPREAYRYDKHHLVPFGEFIPPGFRWFTRADAHPAGRLHPRPDRRAVVRRARPARRARTSATRTCSAKSWRRASRDPARAPTVFANVSNIGWFGDTVADRRSTCNISRMRALEFQRPMLRATNTGATAVDRPPRPRHPRRWRRTRAACWRRASRAARA